jgi:hypothetical protein
MKSILAHRINSANDISSSAEQVPEKGSHNFSFPVIRIDARGRILYANKASFPLLKEWNCLANDYLPDKLIYSFPGLLDSEANFDLKMETRNTLYSLDVVGFKECGYIGLYGYKTEYGQEEKIQQALRIEI